MRDIIKLWRVGVVALALATLLGGRALAQEAGLRVTWWSVDGGGSSSSGGSWSLSGSAGQADAGTSRGGSFTLESGFWNYDVGRPRRPIHLPLISQ